MPHARCDLGRIALEGRNGTPDLPAAMRWFRPEAEEGTVPQPSITWPPLRSVRTARRKVSNGCAVRRNKGIRRPRSSLADRLSDGFTTRPEYAEAFYWLTLSGREASPRCNPCSDWCAVT